MSKLKLGSGVKPTESYDLEHVKILMRNESEISAWVPEGPSLGARFRENAPLRAKINPPHELGNVLIIKGRVWGDDTREPLERVRMDVWQANAEGRYDDHEGPANPENFINRARLYCDQDGYYEFETVHPGAYEQEGPNGIFQRAPHIHFRVRDPDYVHLVTELFFKGDPYHDVDPFFKSSLVIELSKKERNGKIYYEGIFDIVLSRRPDEVQEGQKNPLL
jgi:catechol 1,2-dioxygenase